MTFIDTVVTGLATGLGAALGTWLANRGIIKRLERYERKLKRRVKRK